MRGEFTGSTGSLPSIGTSSVSDYCPTPDPNGKNGSSKKTKNGESSSSRGEGNGRAVPKKPASVAVTAATSSRDSKLGGRSGIIPEVRISPEADSQGGVPIVKRDSVAEASSREAAALAQEVVRNCLESAAAKLQLEVSRTAQQSEGQAQTHEHELVVNCEPPSSHGKS